MGGLGLPELIIILLILAVPVAVVGVLVLLVKNTNRNAKKQCGYCAEWIQKGANICRFCGREVANR